MPPVRRNQTQQLLDMQQTCGDVGMCNIQDHPDPTQLAWNI